MKNDWKQEKNFVEGVAKVRKVKELREEERRLVEEETILEEEAKELLKEAREARYKFLSELYRQKQEELRELIENRGKQEKEKMKSICEKMGHFYHIQGNYKFDNISREKGKKVHLGKPYRIVEKRKCLLCGYTSTTVLEKEPMEPISMLRTEPPEIPKEYKKRMQEVSKEIDIKIATLQEELKEIQSSLMELCQLFGHDIQIKYENRYGDRDSRKCECCGKRMFKEEYKEDFKRVPYKGIVPYAIRYVAIY